MKYEDLLRELVSQDERIVIVTAENRASIRELPSLINGRFIDVGIAEQTMIGMSAGLALRGRIPIAHALATFLTMRAFEFIRTDIGISGLPVKLVGYVPGFLSEANGPTHQAIEDISLMRGIPGMNVFCPADEQDMLIGLKKVIESPEPFYIRFNSLKNYLLHDTKFEIGKAELVIEGSDITILTYGLLFKQSFEAAKILESKGLSVRLVNLRTLKPIDESTILKAAKETKMIVTIEDHFITGGLYSIIGELFLKNCIMIPVLPFAMNNKWFKPVLLDELLEYEKFTSMQIALKILANYKSKLGIH